MSLGAVERFRAMGCDVAVAGGGPARVTRHLWSGDRSANKRASAGAALELLLARATGEDAG